MPADSSSKAATAAGPALRSRTRSPRSTISHPSPVTTAGFWRPTSKPGLGSALPTGPGRCAAGTCTGPADADEAGARVLRDLAAGPSQISAVSAWLRPGHFSRAGHGELYDVMRDLADAGQSVDPVTVGGGVAPRHRGRRSGSGRWHGAVRRGKRQGVHRRGLLGQVASAGQDIQATAEDQRSAPGLVLRSADELLRRIALDRRPGAWQPAGSASRAELGTG
jgi:hypothetical protein